jgi:hypothetical protein
MNTNAHALRLQLVQAGYLPIPLYGKAPPIFDRKTKRKGFGGWQNIRDISPDMIDMWSRTWPDAANTGVLTFNMPTLDVDILDEAATKAIAEFVRDRYEDAGYVLVRIGKPPKFAIPFRTEEPFKKFVANLIAANGAEVKIEFLADGEQVVVAGSHPDTQQPYRWSNGGLEQVKHGDLPYIRETEARALVWAIVEMLCRDFGYKHAPGRKSPNGGKPAPKDGGGGGDSDWTYLFENIRAGRELHDSIRDLAAKMIACGTKSGAAINQLRALMEGSEAPQDERWRARVSEIPAAVDSAVAKFGKGARSSSEPLPKLEPEPEPAPEPESEPELKPKYRFELKPHSTITMSTAPTYLVKGILPRAGLVVAWGPPKCGKSFWVYDLVMHVACGRKYRGHRVHQGPVVYLALEGATGFARRVEAWKRKHLSAREEPVPFYLVDVPIDLVADQKALIADIRKQAVNRPSIIVIDTLNRAISGDENESKDIRQFIRAVDAIRAAFNCLVIVIHHCGVTKSRPRGHTSLAGANDGQIRIERDRDNNIIATVEFMKDAEDGTTVASLLEKVELGTDTDGDAITSCVIARSSAETELKLPKGAALALEVLRKLINSAIDSITAPTEAQLPPGTRIARQDRWREHYFNASPADTDEAKRKAFKRAHETLIEAKIIDFWDVYVWIAPPKPSPDKPDKT